MAQTSLTYSLVVTSAVYGQQGGTTALHFANALFDAGHRLHTVFFYQEGVSHGNCFVTPAADEFNIYHGWVELAQKSVCELAVCVAAAERRGVLDEAVAKLHDKTGCNLMPPFRLAGLGEMSAAILDSDRVVQL